MTRDLIVYERPFMTFPERILLNAAFREGRFALVHEITERAVVRWLNIPARFLGQDNSNYSSAWLDSRWYGRIG